MPHQWCVKNAILECQRNQGLNPLWTRGGLELRSSSFSGKHPSHSVTGGKKRLEILCTFLSFNMGRCSPPLRLSPANHGFWLTIFSGFRLYLCLQGVCVHTPVLSMANMLLTAHVQSKHRLRDQEQNFYLCLNGIFGTQITKTTTQATKSRHSGDQERNNATTNCTEFRRNLTNGQIVLLIFIQRLSFCQVIWNYPLLDATYGITMDCGFDLAKATLARNTSGVRFFPILKMTQSTFP